jgi:hypothetical protein
MSIIDKLLLPNVYVKIIGASSGFGLGYGYSYYNNYKKYKYHVPSKVHILPSVLTGIIGYYMPIVPIFTGTFLVAVSGLVMYNDWEKNVIQDYIKKVKE